MTKKRHEEIEDIRKQLEAIHDRLQQIYKDEHDYYDNLADSARGTDRWNISEESLEVLDEVIDHVFMAAAAIHDDMPSLSK